MASRCGEFEALIDREAHGWSEAERLRVEHHLNDCHDCRSTLSLSRVVRDVIDEAASNVSHASIDRALERAFVANANQPRQVYSAKRSVLAASSVFAVAAAIALMVWTRASTAPTSSNDAVARGPSRPPVAAPLPEPSAEPTEKVAAKPAAEPAWIETTHSEVRTFAHASVRLSADTRVRFDDVHSELMLERGSVEVSVDPVPQRPFRVSTSRFRVEVLGTRFVVDEASVVVTEGRVRVVDHQDRVLASELAAGSRFTFDEEKSAASDEDKAGPTSARVTADAWLSKARAALARNDMSDARTLITRADRSNPRRIDKAEALTLRAELALVERDSSAAIGLYERVAKQYGDLPAGENGAFAAAQLAARSDAARARTLFERYLTRYPSGRFVAEAQKRLSTLKTK